jgi:glycosyltransferase involved in cell wall biosynthesis
LKILFANKFFYLNGGSETVFFQEKDFLIKNGYNIIDFSMKDDRNFPSTFTNHFVPNINYQNTRSIKKIQQAFSFIHSSTAVKNIENLIKTEKPSIAHLHNIYHQLTPSIIPVLKKHGVKVVLTLHDYKLICPGYLALKNDKICNACKGCNFLKPFTTNCQNSYFQGLLLAIEAFFHKWKGSYNPVDLFLAPSKFMADQISQRIPSNKIRVLHNGIDINSYKPNYDDHGYGLFFGRLSKEKGIETLLKAHKNLSVSLPLKIIGTGPLETALKKQYPNVEFLGYKSGQELNTLISNAAFVVVPSEWYENCSMVVLESMALGKPVIGSRAGGIPEQIEDGETGFLFEMNNKEELTRKMILCAENKNLRRKFGKNARQKLESTYSLYKHCHELEKIYKRLLK